MELFLTKNYYAKLYNDAIAEVVDKKAINCAQTRLALIILKTVPVKNTY